MRRKKSPLRSLRPAPAHEKARIAITRLLAGGSCVFTVEQLAETAEVSTTTARDFIKAGIAAGLFVDLQDRVPVAQSGQVLVLATFPGAPTAETILLSALAHVAGSSTGDGGSASAFAYHTALALHGLTEVAAEGLHLVKVRSSVHPPALPDTKPYTPVARAPKEWLRLSDKRPVWLTLRSSQQVPRPDIVAVVRDQMPLPVTSPMRTLIDAWMHPDWCGGEDRVADSWRMYWTSEVTVARRSDLAVLLATTTWPGLWRPLADWAAGVAPGLRGLAELTERVSPTGTTI